MRKTFKEIVDFIRQLYNNPKGIIPLHAPIFIGNEKKYVDECIESTYVSSIGKFVDTFEEKMADYTGSKRAVACVNGTNALHLALKLIGVERDHHVITQPLTFVATANAIIYCGAQPIFLDVDMDTMGLSPESLLKFLETHSFYNKSTNQLINRSSNKPITACVPMHTFGHPCRIQEIVEICDHYHIPVVEDAAESLGSFYKGHHTGTYGKIGVLSFNGNKIITTGGGGMLLFNDEEMAKHAKHLSTQAKLPHPWEFSHDEIGYNNRMPNINAALGLGQLELLNHFLKSKRMLSNEYAQFFEKKNISYCLEPPDSKANYWLNCIIFNKISERNEFLEYTHNNGIITRPAWQLMNSLSMFTQYQNYDLVNSRLLSERLVNIPSSYRTNYKML